MPRANRSAPLPHQPASQMAPAGIRVALPPLPPQHLNAPPALGLGAGSDVVLVEQFGPHQPAHVRSDPSSPGATCKFLQLPWPLCHHLAKQVTNSDALAEQSESCSPQREHSGASSSCSSCPHTTGFTRESPESGTLSQAKIIFGRFIRTALTPLTSSWMKAHLEEEPRCWSINKTQSSSTMQPWKARYK